MVKSNLKLDADSIIRVAGNTGSTRNSVHWHMYQHAIAFQKRHKDKNMARSRPFVLGSSHIFVEQSGWFDHINSREPIKLNSSPRAASMDLAKVVFGFFVVIVSSSEFSQADPGFFGWGGNSPFTGGSFGLFPQYYQFSCPQANDIVMSVLEKAIAKDPRMAASLLRLHFHDCFVQGCDASVLLDDSANIRSEKNALPNRNSLRGFQVIDEIKAKLEEACPQTISCADILALAARGSTVLSGGPNWELPLGRRDSKTASFRGANNNIPPPNSTIQNLITFFKRQGLNEVDLVALSGGHTIGVARCATFKQRLYNQNGNDQPDETLDKSYYMGLKSVCPRSGGDNNISPMDFASPTTFDNAYFKLILWGKGLLTSDAALFAGNNGKAMELVKSYAENEGVFFGQFAESMVRMGNINPLTGFKGEVRKNCRRIN